MNNIRTVGQGFLTKPIIPLAIGGGILLVSWMILNYTRQRRLLYLGEFYRQKGPKIWSEWGSLDADTILGIYNIAENILRQIRKGIASTHGYS